VSDVLDKFQCFHVPFGADLCERHSLFKPAGLYVLAPGEMPCRKLVNDGLVAISAKVIVRFLDDTPAPIGVSEKKNAANTKGQTG